MTATAHTATRYTDPFLGTLVAAAVDCVVVFDTKGVIQVYNAACKRLFGYRADEVLGKNVRVLMASSFNATHDERSTTGEEQIIDSSREIVGRRKDGSTFPVYILIGEGILSGQKIFVGIIRELTEFERPDSAEINRSARLSSILDTGPDAILIINDRGTIETFNPAAERLFGYGVDEVLGKNVTILAPPGYRDQHYERLARYRRTGEIRNIAINGITVGQRRDGTIFPIKLFVGEFWIGKRRLITCFVRDTTERQRLEQRLRDLQSELVHVSRLSAVGQISSAFAHELNQPLTAIMNYVSAAVTTLSTLEGAQAGQSREWMEKAINQTARAGEIIRNLRDFVEKGESSRSYENLNEVVKEAVGLGFLGFVDTNVKVILELDSGVEPILIDKIQIEQVLVNLIRNSVEAMQATTMRELTIRTATTADGFVEVDVSDTGPGLSEEVASRLFQPFVTTKEKGMGIGLTICQSIIEAHNGRIWAVQTTGGAEFHFRLPATHLE